MIIKSFEISKIDLKKKQFFLFYGENEGFKKQIIEEKFKKFYIENNYTYTENEILQNQEDFFEEILTKSFFETEKLVIINRVTDKIKDLVEDIIEKKNRGFNYNLRCSNLRKKIQNKKFV